MLFADRREGGRRLVAPLARWAGRIDVRVLALPRGGVPVGFELARGLGVPLDAYVVRRLGVPGHADQAVGALGSGGVIILDHPTIDSLGMSEEQLRELVTAEWAEVRRRERDYRGAAPLPDVGHYTVILADDGLSTSATLLAAVAALRKLEPARVVLTAPVADSATCTVVRPYVDDIVCAEAPRPFRTVAHWYQDYAPVNDDEVAALLATARFEAEEPVFPY
jgi:putative phosphoribosyl transferase